MSRARIWCVVAFLSALPALSAAAEPSPALRQAIDTVTKQGDLQLQFPVPKPQHAKEPDVSLDGDLTLGRIFAWIAVIGGAIVLAIFLKDILPSGGLARHAKWDADDPENGGSGSARDIQRAQSTADELAQQGRYMEAMHVLLLQGLSEMRKRLDQTFADSLTSREIMRRANVPNQARLALQHIIGAVERAYFGEYPVGQRDYVTCRAAFVDFRDALQARARG